MDERQRAAALRQARMARFGPPPSASGSLYEEGGSGMGPLQPQLLNQQRQRTVRFEDEMSPEQLSRHRQSLASQKAGSNAGSKLRSALSKRKAAGVATTENSAGLGLSPRDEAATTGTSTTSDLTTNTNVLARMFMSALLVAAIFVMPQGYKAFWVMIVAIVMLSYIGFQLYYEWDRKSFDGTATVENQEKYRSWAIGMLYAMNALMTAVVAGLLMVMVWRIYSMVSRRSNLARSKDDVDDEEAAEKESKAEALADERALQDEMAIRESESSLDGGGLGLGESDVAGHSLGGMHESDLSPRELRERRIRRRRLERLRHGGGLV